MSSIVNGVQINKMTYNGQEVQTWLHNGVEVYGGKVQLKYVITFIKDNSGAYPVNLKIYSMKDESLIKELNFNIVSNGGTVSNPYSYDDRIVNIKWGSLTYGRWTFTPLVKGTATVDGVANKGSDYAGGTSEQLVPYTANKSCTITFITTDKHKVS